MSERVRETARVATTGRTREGGALTALRANGGRATTRVAPTNGRAGARAVPGLLAYVGALAAVALALLLGMAQLDTAQARQGVEDAVLAGAMQASSPCDNGVVIPDLSIRSELVADCEVLWRVRSALGGESLDWSGAAGIGEWEGVEQSFVDESLGRNTSGTLRVREVNLVSAGLTGSIPPALGELPALWRLDLSDNDFQGSIPAELSKLSALDYLGLADNRLTGTIPAAFGKLSKLQRMDISNNRLSGDVPVEFCNLTNLVHVEVEGNGNPLEFRESCLNVSIPRVEGPGILQVEENHRGALATYSATDEQGHNVSWSLGRPERGGLATVHHRQRRRPQIQGSARFREPRGPRRGQRVLQSSSSPQTTAHPT